MQSCQVPGLSLSSAKASIATSAAPCIVHQVWKWETFGIPLQKGKDLVDAVRERNTACPATVMSSSHCTLCWEYRNRIQIALNSPILT